MESVHPAAPDAARRHRRLTRSVKDALRDASLQLSLLNHQVSGRLELRASDLACLDLISTHGPVSPTELARLAGQHPATMTGILDRLERGGWITRDRDPADRRGVVIHAARGRARDVLRLFAGMNSALDEICAGYSEQDLELLAGFLRRTASAGRTATTELCDAD
jgi:DNA-binding MarR family transcriptional regulator